MIDDSSPEPNLEKELAPPSTGPPHLPPKHNCSTLKPRTVLVKRTAADVVTPRRESTAKRHELDTRLRGTATTTTEEASAVPPGDSTTSVSTSATADPFLAPPTNRPLPTHLSFNRILLPEDMEESPDVMDPMPAIPAAPVTPIAPVTPAIPVGTNITLAPTPAGGFAPIQLPADLLTRFSKPFQLEMVLEQEGKKVIVLIASDKLSNNGDLRRKVVDNVLPALDVTNLLVMQVPVDPGRVICTGFRVPTPLVITGPTVDRALVDRLVGQRCFSSSLGTFFTHSYPIPILTHVTILKNISAPNEQSCVEKIVANIQRHLYEDPTFAPFVNTLRDGHDNTASLGEAVARILGSVTIVATEPTSSNANLKPQWHLEMLCPGNTVGRWVMWVEYLCQRQWPTIFGTGISIGQASCNYCQCITHTLDYCTYSANGTLYPQVPLTMLSSTPAGTASDIYLPVNHFGAGSGQRGNGRGGARGGQGRQGRGQARGHSY